MTAPSTPQPSHPTERPPLLALVDHRPGELPKLLLCGAWIFLALTAYYIIKPIRSTILQKVIGVDYKSTALLATTVAVGLFAVAYGQVAARASRHALLLGTYLTAVGCLGAFAIALPWGTDIGAARPWLGYAFFIWVSTFNLLVVSQFWSVTAEVWSREQGQRLFGAIGIGAVAGGIFGTQVVGRLGKTGLGWLPKLHTYQLLLVASVILLGCLALALLILRTSKASDVEVPAPDANERAEASPDANERADAFRMVLRSPYLRTIAAMMLLLNVVNTNNEWIMDKVVSRAHMDEGSLNAWYADYYFVQNALTFLVQVFLTSRVQRRFGARGGLVVEPALGLLGGLALLVYPSLAVARALKIAENAADYSIQSNTRELLYVPVTHEEKYAAKSFNDTFVVRLGDALAAGFITIASAVLIPRFGDYGLRALVVVDLVLGVAWLAMVFRIGRIHRAKMEVQATR